MSVRRGLPFVATEVAGAKDDPCDLLLGRTVAMSIERAKHFPLTRKLLPGEARIGRNDTAVKHCKQSEQCFYPIKTVPTQRDDGSKRRISARFGREKQLNALRGIAAPQQAVATVVCSENALELGLRLVVGCRHFVRGLSEQDDTGVETRVPENVCCRNIEERVDGEIATPIAGGFDPTACQRWQSFWTRLQSPDHRLRYVEATPRQYRMLTNPRRDRNRPRIANAMRPASSQSSPYASVCRGGQRFPDELSGGRLSLGSA
jgi:hypothetical protein